MKAPKKYITAKSWNGTKFYFNVYEQTWEMAEDTVLTQEHDATEEDLPDARIRAKKEAFLAEDMQLLEYVEV